MNCNQYVVPWIVLSRFSIQSLLGERGVRLLPADKKMPSQRWRATARYLAENYLVFDGVRVRLNQSANPHAPACHAAGAREQQMLDLLQKRGFVTRRGDGYRLSDNRLARSFLTGGWLEWLSREALMAARADEALCCQRLAWRVGRFQGKNEIDVIGRKDGGLVFVSCKAAKAVLRKEGNQRSQLMSYLHEADDLYDHFGRQGDQVILVVSTDLIDEAMNHRARYPALFGKASVLDVHLLTLEDLEWNRLVRKMGDVLDLF